MYKIRKESIFSLKKGDLCPSFYQPVRPFFPKTLSPTHHQSPSLLLFWHRIRNPHTFLSLSLSPSPCSPSSLQPSQTHTKTCKRDKQTTPSCSSRPQEHNHTPGSHVDRVLDVQLGRSNSASFSTTIFRPFVA